MFEGDDAVEMASVRARPSTDFQYGLVICIHVLYVDMPNRHLFLYRIFQFLMVKKLIEIYSRADPVREGAAPTGG